MSINIQQALRKCASLINRPPQPYVSDLPTRPLATEPLPQRQHVPNKSRVVRTSQSSKTVSFLFRVFILLALPVTIPFIINQTHYYGHTAGTLAIPTDGQGIYDGCTPYSYTGDIDPHHCFANIDQMAAGGFNVVLNYGAGGGGNAQGLIDYLNYAHQKGMKVILSMHGNEFWNGSNLLTTYPDMASTCNCTDNTGFITYVVNLVKGNPGLWGYYIGDEVLLTDHDKIKAYSDLLHTLDPTHPRLIVQQSSSTNGININGWADVADVVAQDYYPVGVDGADYTLAKAGTWAASVQSYATQNGKDSGFVLQAMSWQQYYEAGRCNPYPSCAPYPSVSQMESMLGQTLQNMHPRLILWYSYFDTTSWDKQNNATQYWNDLVTAIKSIYTTSTPLPVPTNTPTPTPLPVPTNTPTPTIIPTPMPVSTNLILNGSFENTGRTWLAPWHWQSNSRFNATIKQVSGTKVDGNYSARAYMPVSGADYNVELYQGNLSLISARNYTITFWAKASVARKIRVVVAHGVSPWRVYFVQTVNLTRSWHKFTIIFTISTTDSNTLLAFDLAQTKGYVWLDAVSLQ